ncbi:MAG TPA: hypothetical protein VFB66_05460 [Tepidisphaeraceae bacterium]|nr:hypothetical protein [Tepidisphaeraceae bacterium]
MKNWLRKLPWRRVGLVVAGAGVTALGVVFPPVAPITTLVGPGLIGAAVPSEYAAKIGTFVLGLVKKK